MKQCSAIDSAIAPSSHRFLQGGSCDKHQIAPLYWWVPLYEL